MAISIQDAQKLVCGTSTKACAEINSFSLQVLSTRGGRMGSGMGMLLEALWCYYQNQELYKLPPQDSCEIAWITENQYNDYACIERNNAWDASLRTGEFFRIEAKSMNLDADESKAHFDELNKNVSDYDLLLVMVWKWETKDGIHFSPIIKDHFIGLAKSIVLLRDELHILRGGSFVNKNTCPENCDPSKCTHDGEPLNAAGKRERLSGPPSLKPSSSVSYAANFGGLIRMIKTSSTASSDKLRFLRKSDPTIHEYISFIHRNFPQEELNQFNAPIWKALADKLKITTNGIGSKDDLVQLIKTTFPTTYQEELKNL